MSANAYDQVVYESHPFANSHPEHLYTIGKLFDLNPVHFRHARVLELGCASGGNIIPHAQNYPEAEFLGIDLSSVQINQGLQVISTLGLKNIRLETQSILDMSAADGLFDYIICHGVLSWVPENVREKIFDICKTNLSPQGIAFVSYNTLPGWSMVSGVREMMRYHTAHILDPKEKASQARNLLKFVSDTSSAIANKTYGDCIERELTFLNEHDDFYLLHDHLEENNTQFYFYDFVKSVEKKDLQYLADAEVFTMYPHNFDQKVVEALSQINNLIQAEQYMDFFRGRRFRQSLLCHKDVRIDRELKPESLLDFYITSKIQPENPQSIDLSPSKNHRMDFVGATRFSSTNRLISALYVTLWENRFKPITVEQLAQKTLERLGSHSGSKSAEYEILKMTFLKNALHLYFINAIVLYADPGAHVAEVPLVPKITPLTRYQVTHQTWATNALHNKITLSDSDCALLQRLDGQHSVENLIQLISERLQKTGGRTVKKKRTTKRPAQIQKEAKLFVTERLDAFAKLGLLRA